MFVKKLIGTFGQGDSLDVLLKDSSPKLVLRMFSKIEVS